MPCVALAKHGLLKIKLMYYVYLIQSIKYPEQKYVGFTTDLKNRLETHNSGGSTYTKAYMPWRLITYLGFSDKRQAKEFEYYLKSSSGKAFANKRLWS